MDTKNNDSTETFTKKVHTLLDFHIPLVDELLKAEQSAESPLQKGTVMEFLQELDGVVRWTKSEIYWNPDKQSYITVPQKSKNEHVSETDLDHVIAMVLLAHEIFDTTTYPALQASIQNHRVKNGIIVHDGGEIGGVGDSTHADEASWKATRMERKEKEHLSFTSFFRKHALFQSLGEKLEKDLYASYFDEEFELNTEGSFVVFLDRLQAVSFAFENIYPYEVVYRNEKTLHYYLREYILTPVVNVLKQLKDAKAREELSHFLVSTLPLSSVAKSYQHAVKMGRITQEQSTMLIATVERSLHDFYNNNVDVFLTAWNIAETNFQNAGE